MENIKRMDLEDVELTGGSVYRSFLLKRIGKEDNGANCFGIRAFRNGEPVNLEGGSVQGFFRNAQGNNIALTTQGSISGNTAYITLPQACYNYDGQFTLAIKIIGGGVTGTMRIVDGIVDNTNTGGAVAPTETIPTYAEILAVYEQMEAAKEGSLRFDIEQDLTDEDKQQIRENASVARAETEKEIAHFAYNWTLGGLSDSTGEKTKNNTRIFTDNFIPVEAGTVIHSSADYDNYVVYFYDKDKTWDAEESVTEWTNEDTVIQGNGYIRIAMRKDAENSRFTNDTSENVPWDDPDTTSKLQIELIYPSWVTDGLLEGQRSTIIERIMWEIGSLSESTGKPTVNNTRIRTGFIPVTDGSTIIFHGNYNGMCVYAYDREKTWNDEGSAKVWSKNTYTADFDGYVRIIQRKNESNSTVTNDDIPAMSAQIEVNSKMPSWIYNDVFELQTEHRNNYQHHFSWEIGSLSNSTGNPTDNNTRIRTGFIKVSPGAKVVLHANFNGMCVYAYSKRKTWIQEKSVTSWSDDDYVSDFDGYIRIIQRKNGSNNTITTDDIPAIANRIEFDGAAPDWENDSTSEIGSELCNLSEYNSYRTELGRHKRCLTFGAITDIHNAQNQWSRFCGNVNDLSLYIDAGVFLGDAVQSPTADNFILPGDLNVPLLFCIGNHDVGYSTDTISISDAFTKYIQPLVSAEIISTDKCYYYKDFASYKIRVITLFEYEATVESSSASGYNYRRYITTTQLQWFADTLYNTPTDYSVVVLTHQVVHENPMIVESLFTEIPAYRMVDSSFADGSGGYGYMLNNMNGNCIGDIVNAFINRTAINETYTNNISMPSSTVQKNFSARGADGKFICYLSGHTHAPFILRDGTYNDQIQVLLPSGSDSYAQRRGDDIRPLNDEENYYYIAFNTDRKVVKILKAGGRMTCDMRGRDFIEIQYGT